MAQLTGDSLEAGRQAVSRNAWRDAYRFLREADEVEELAGPDLESLAAAAWWTGRLEEALALRERAYTTFSRSGEPSSAAMVAVVLAMDHMVKGAPSVAAGWLARAETI